MHPDDYQRIPRCGCGRERRAIETAKREGRPRPQTWRVDKYRNSGREQRGRNCRCAGYSFVHYIGRGFCFGNPNLTDEMLQERYESGAWA